VIKMATYAFDHTAISADNLIQDEVHSTNSSVAVFPTAGAFYRHGLIVEGTVSLASPQWTPLVANVDYQFSPLFLAITADTGEEAYTYLVIERQGLYIRLVYQAVGHHVVDGVQVDVYEDKGLLDSIRSATFNPLSTAEWLNFRGSDGYNTRFKRPLLNNDEFCTALIAGVGELTVGANRLSPGSDVATLQQVTGVEIRQGYVEDRQNTVESNFGGVKQSYLDAMELFDTLNTTIETGFQLPVPTVDSFAYNSPTAIATHTITHGLNSFSLDVQIWAEDDNGRWSVPLHDAMMLDANTVIVNSSTPIRIRAVIRKVTAGGHVYENIVPATTVDINHNLSTGFLSICVWVDINGIWTQTVYEAETISNNVVRITMDAAQLMMVVLQQPLPNSYIAKYNSAQPEQFVTHRLNSSYLSITLWMEVSPGRYRRDLVDIELDGLNAFLLRFDNTTPTVKVVVQPSTWAAASVASDLSQSVVNVSDRQDGLTLLITELQNELTLVHNYVTALQGATWDYISTTPTTIHNLPHNLNDDFCDVIIWVQDATGKWRRDVLGVENVDANNMQIVLSAAGNVRARVSRS